MVASNFAPSLACVLGYEGGYSNHPDDPGGPTMKGIIQREYDAYRRSKGRGTQSVKLIEDAELRDIYRKSYWDASRCDDLPAGVDLVVFDASVNSGVAQSAKWLQRSVGAKDDGVIGTMTVDAALSAANKAGLIDAMCDRRLAMLKGLKTWGSFGKGWASRVADVRKRGKALLSSTPPAPPMTMPAEDMAKAPVSEKSVSTIAMSKESVLAGIPIVTGLVNAAANPGPLAWAVAVAVIIAVAIGAFYFVKAQRKA